MIYNSTEYIIALSGKIGCIIADSEDSPPWEGTTIYPINDEQKLKIMQLIGLKDINKKEIYEGDILDSEDGEYWGEVFWDDEEMCYMCGSKDGASNNLAKEDLFHDAKVSVKGNIYENPELLKEEKSK